MRRTGFAALLVSVLILAAASLGYAQSAEDISGHWKFHGGNAFDAASHVEFYLDGDVLVEVLVFDQSISPNVAGQREEFGRFRKVRDNVFHRWNSIQEADITLEFHGNTIFQTIVGSGWKAEGYFTRQ